jgi:uncharacterized protein
MNDFADRYGKWVLVAGSAEGLGAAFSEALASRKMNLVMADIRADKLEALAERLSTTYGILTKKVVIDLSGGSSWSSCLKEINGLDCRLLVYVPAYSPVKTFTSNSLEDLDRYLSLNCATPIKMVWEFCRMLPENKGGGILLMSSLAGIVGPKYVAPYAASRAFSILLGESLHHELKMKGISVTVCCAGPTSTPTYWESHPDQGRDDTMLMEPDTVAEYALKCLGRKAVCIAGWKNRASYFLLTRILGRKIAGTLVNRAMSKLYRNL